jgi:NTE family protein
VAPWLRAALAHVPRRPGGRIAAGLAALSLVAGCASPFSPARPAPSIPASSIALAQPAPPAAATAPAVAAKPRIALALGGGAARGFAHIGVIKALEAQGIEPDIVVGTSAGSLVGALYASGMNGFDLQKAALAMEDGAITDWSLPSRGVIKGEALQNYVNREVTDRPIEKMPRQLAIVATNLQTGEALVFRSGNTGMAVRASSSVPGVFQPVAIGGQEYVDGGLVAPVPVRIARAMGADIVIAVDISARPRTQKTLTSFEVLLQTFAIMGQSLVAAELPLADVVVQPDVGRIAGTDFNSRNLAVLEGERAAQEQMPKLRTRIAAVAAQLAARGPASASTPAPATAAASPVGTPVLVR